jgi:hypothetical protein
MAPLLPDVRRLDVLHRLLVLALLCGACSGPGPSARRRPPPDAAVARRDAAAPTPPARVAIPVPPPRLDVRLDPATAALVPGRPAVVAALRPDAAAAVAALVGKLAPRPEVAAWAASVVRLAGGDPRLTDLAAAWGVRVDRLVVFSLRAMEAPSPLLDPAAVGDPARLAALLRDAWAGGAPSLTWHLRLVAPIADEARTRESLTRAVGALAGRPQPVTKDLKAAGVLAFALAPGERLAVLAAVRQGQLVVDAFTRLTGGMTPASAAALAATTPGNVREADPLADPFVTIHLAQGADLAVLAEPLAISALLPAIALQRSRGEGSAARIPTLATTLRAAEAAPALVGRLGLILHATAPRPVLRASWQLTARGAEVVGPPTAAVAGRDLTVGSTLIEAWLRPLEEKVRQAAPTPVSPTEDDLGPVAVSLAPRMVSDLWLRLLPDRGLRKVCLTWLRGTLRPGRLVSRMTAEVRGPLLQVTLEGR